MTNKSHVREVASIKIILCINAFKKVIMLLLTVLFSCNLFAQPPAARVSDKTACSLPGYQVRKYRATSATIVKRSRCE